MTAGGLGFWGEAPTEVGRIEMSLINPWVTNVIYIWSTYS